jgi:transposase
MPDHKTEDYKQSAVDYYLVGDNTQEEVCQIFKCSVRSLMHWVDKFENNGEIKRHNRKSIAYKVHKNEVKFILEQIKINKTITMEDLLEKLKIKFPDIDISERHLSRIVKDNNVSLKITRFRHEPTKRFGKDIDINKNLKEFYKVIKKYKLDDIICIDETSIKSLQKRHHCYSDVGESQTLSEPQVPKRHVKDV